MSTISLLRHLKETPEVSSANKLASQYRVAVTTVTRMLREAGYTYTGETWSSPRKPSVNSQLSISEETFNKFQASAERYAKEEVDYSASLKDALQKAIEAGNYKNATVICFSLYVLANQPLPLVL